MKTKLAVGLGLIVLAIGLYVFLHERAPATRPDEVAAPAGKPSKPEPTPASAGKGAGSAQGGGQEREERLDVADDPPGQLRLEGQVIDADEHPVAGATVGLSSNPPRQVKSEGDGSFVFDKLVGRQYSVYARKDESFGGPVSIKLTAKKEPVIIVLKPSGGLEVTVVAQETRKPIAGAEVELGEDEGMSGTTGADGKVVMKGLSSGWQQVVARAPGYAPAQTFAESGEKAGLVEKVTIELKKGAGVSGTVVDGGGKPVSGAKVHPIATSALFEVPGGRKDTAISDAKGAWSFPALPEGTFRFSAAHEAHGPGTSAPVTLDGKSDRKDLLITLEDGAHIAGVVSRKAGGPVAGAMVRVQAKDEGWSWAPTRQAYTDEKGGFDIGGLPRRKSDLIAIEESAASEPIELDLEAKPEQTGLAITLDVEGSISGFVVNPKGEAVPDAQVSAVPEMGTRKNDPSKWRLRGIARDTTDSAGKFELGGLAEGNYRLRVGRSGDLAAVFFQTSKTTTAKTGDKDVKLVLEDDGKVKGHVLYTDGSAPEVFNVSTGFGRGTPFSGSDGAFELDAPGGTTMLTVTGPTFVQKTVSDIEVKGGEVKDVGTINVERGRSISGRVVNGAGQPVAGAKVVAGPQLMGSGSELSTGGLFGAGPGVKSGTSGDDGSYVLSGVAARPMVIAAELSGEGRSNMVRVPASTTSIQIDLTILAYGSLEGKVTSGGKPLGPAVMLAQPQQASRGTFIVRTGEDGVYKFDKLAPDTYRVSATQGAGGMSGGMVSKIVTVEPEQTATLDFEVPVEGVTVTLTVQPPAGVAVPTAQVILVSGKIDVTNADQFTDRLGEMGPGSFHQGFVIKSEPVKLDNIQPGSYSACGIPIPGDINSMADMIKLRDKMDKLIVACQPVTVAADPKEQTISVKVPAPPPI